MQAVEEEMDPSQALAQTVQQQSQELQFLQDGNLSLDRLRPPEVLTFQLSLHPLYILFFWDPNKVKEFLDSLTVFFTFRTTQFTKD